MRNTCKNHRAGKVCFPSKSSSQVRGCLSPTAIVGLDVFFLTLIPDPQPSPLSEVSAPCFTELLSPASREAFPSTWLRAGGGRSVLQHVMQLLRALWPRSNAAVVPGQPAINTLTLIPQRTTDTFQKEI